MAALEVRLGLSFSRKEVAVEALTHKSWVNEHRESGAVDNERLEFLGDAVVDLAVSHRLMEKFPQAQEGELSKLRARLVSEEALSQIARDMELGELLALGKGEEMTGGRKKASLLADSLEAVMGAVYLTGGLPMVLELVDRLFGAALEQAASGAGKTFDYKTALQELAQAKLRKSPKYRVCGERGPEHEKTFEVELSLDAEVIGRGEGHTKKEAEQSAARQGLERVSRRLAGPPDEKP